MAGLESIIVDLTPPRLDIQVFNYRKVASSNMSRLEAHAGFFRLVMKGIFYPYVL